MKKIVKKYSEYQRVDMLPEASAPTESYWRHEKKKVPERKVQFENEIRNKPTKENTQELADHHVVLISINTYTLCVPSFLGYCFKVDQRSISVTVN